MQRSFLFVGNWKMELSYNESVAFFKNHYTELEQLASHAAIVLCPSFDALDYARHHKPNNVAIGAQDASNALAGAYTGEVSAISLRELDCPYCIVGHSERRRYHNEPDEHIVLKMIHLINQGITPIVCIGEQEEEHAAHKTMERLRSQLDLILYAAQQYKPARICIAYEPVWAIGTGKVPQKEELSHVLTMLYKEIIPQLPDTKVQLLYGGSINEKNALELASAEHIDGFLIGSASTDFQKFQKIVSLVHNAL